MVFTKKNEKKSDHFFLHFFEYIITNRKQNSIE